MNSKTLKAESLLLSAAAIWGFAFVAQRVGMSYLGPFMFNAIRFALGSLVLIPLLWYWRGNVPADAQHLPYAGICTGLVLFVAISLQQVGMVYTTAGKAGFITGLYVVMVPVLGLFLKQKARPTLLLGIVLAVAGMYLLCITEQMTIAKGDLLVLGGAGCWAVHVQFINHYAGKTICQRLAFEQFVVCALLSFVVGLTTETTTLPQVQNAAMPLLYGGIMSSGVAFTIQIIGQRDVAPAPAAILMSTESVFAVMGGWLFLSETLTWRAIAGCLLILAGMLIAQIYAADKK